MPRHCTDEEWDRDGLFACRNLVGSDFAGVQMKVSSHGVQNAAGRAPGPAHVNIWRSRAADAQVPRQLRHHAAS
jgi:hypothetical protein